MGAFGSPDVVLAWLKNPVQFVRDQFGVEPDAWQAEVLMAATRSMRIAMKACKGPGKTCVLAWLIWWFMVTRPRPKIACTSITGDNLADGLWTELAKWQAKSELLRAEFEWRKQSIVKRGDAGAEWYCVPRTWPRGGDANAQADTLAGKHADYMMFVLDEAGGIPDAVMAAAEAGLANARDGGGKEALLVIAGNPTHLEGPLYRACTQERDIWHVTEITSDPDDPMRTPRVSAEWAREQIKKYGRDNPWVLVNVFGKFPPSSFNTLLGPDDVKEAQERFHRKHEIEHAARVLGVDVAREGDDASVIFPRQGRVAFPPMVMRGASSLTGAGAVARKWKDWDADACFIDNTGGFGAGWIDQLIALTYRPIGIHFAGAPNDNRYVNKRAEMWIEMANWVKEGGALPDCPELVAELTTPQYFFKGDRFQIEDKDQIKERLGRSPDYADALALTFAQPVAKPGPGQVHARMFGGPLPTARRGYKPYSNTGRGSARR